MALWLNAVWIYIGAIIGAGFASGKEIQSFFGETHGLLGLLFAALLFTLCAVRLFGDIFTHKIENYQDYLKLKTGRLAPFFLGISSLFCLSSYCIMVAGSEAVFESYALPRGGIFFALLCFFIFIKGLGGIALVNMLSTPLIVLGMLLTAALGAIPTFSTIGAKSLFYVSYNMLGCLPVFATLAPFFQTKKHTLWAGLLGGGILSLLMLAVFISLPETSSSLPMLDLSKKIGGGPIYGIILLLAMLTTAISSGMGFIKTLKLKPIYSNIILLITACALLPFGFSALVEKLYTFFGIVSSLLVFFIIKPIKVK